jgi:uncharacterized protein (DUF362 family)
MKRISRRKMLKYMASGMVTVAVSQFLKACQINPQETPESTNLPSEAVKPVTPGASATLGATQSTETIPTESTSPTMVSYPDLVVCRNGQPDNLVNSAISALGGMESFVPKGGWVIIKPNICTSYHSYEYAATTNPWVVGTLVKLCFEAGAAKVQVMDSPFGGSAAEAYQTSGIGAQVESNGGEMVKMPAFMFKRVTIENALSLDQVEIYEDVFKADTLINVPIAKNHGMATLTLGMKNLMGLITERQKIHQDFGNRLTDLARTIKPTLTVIDAVRILVRNGPTGGDLADVQELNTLIASRDIVAADSYGATLFGLQPNDLEYVRVGNEQGLGQSDLSKLRIQELNLG